MRAFEFDEQTRAIWAVESRKKRWMADYYFMRGERPRLTRWQRLKTRCAAWLSGARISVAKAIAGNDWPEGGW